MQIPLNQFEQVIDEDILKRGLSYFKKGRVYEPEEISPDEFETIVEGSEDYVVRYKIKNDIIIEFVCSCPFDSGPVCKHVAAVIFYLQQDQLELNKKSVMTRRNQNHGSAKRKTIAEQINEMLEKASHEELKQFIRDITERNISFRNAFLMSFAQHNSHESKEVYAKQVKSILSNAAGRDGFINWSASRLVGNAINNLLRSAEKQVESNNYRSAVFISTAVMEQMTQALQFADDSNGDIGGSIDAAYEILWDIAHKPLPEDVRKQILEYCFQAFDKQIYSGWDWHLGILNIASELAHTKEDIERIFKQIESSNESDYEKEKTQELKYRLLLKTQGQNAASNFIEQHISNPCLRREAIVNAIDNKDFEKANMLANDGVKHDLKEKPGLAKEWYDWLLRIAQKQKNTEKVIEYARMLLIDNFMPLQDYFQILKENVSNEQWNEFVEEVIMDISKTKRWSNSGLIESILIKEEQWDKLLEQVKRHASLNSIEYYEKYLAQKFPDEVVELYAHGIIEYVECNVGRPHYKQACRFIRKIIKLGARDKANEIISSLRKQYPQRKALMEELDKV